MPSDVHQLLIYVNKAIYRDVPTFDEIKAESQDPNLSPKLAENAEAIIDWALSHIPERMF